MVRASDGCNPPHGLGLLLPPPALLHSYAEAADPLATLQLPERHVAAQSANERQRVGGDSIPLHLKQGSGWLRCTGRTAGVGVVEMLGC